MMEWIPVTDRLPEPDVDVLISSPLSRLKVCSGHIKVTGKWFFTSGVSCSFAVNAWMPLPKPYQSNQDYGA